MGNRKIKSRKQKLYNMIGCNLAKRSHKKTKRHNLAYNKKGGQAVSGAYTGYSASNTSYLNPYATKTGGGNPNLPYGNGSNPITPFNNEFPKGVSQPENLRGGQSHLNKISQPVIYGANMASGGKRRRRRGGNSGRWPDGLTGSPWGQSVSQWPGVDGISGDRNYLAYNNYQVDPQTQGIINGRALSGGKTRKLRGGGLLPQDLVNLGRQVMFGVGSAYNGLTGYHAPVNPMPWKDQLPNNPTLNSLEYYRL